MKFSWQILTFLLAVALIVQIIKGSSSAPTADALNAEEAIIENIMTRSSVRAYTSQAIEADKIDILLKAGMAAPTAGNKQPWEFVVINDRATLDQIPDFGISAKMITSSQVAIVVCGDLSRTMPNMSEYWVQDCSAATENILLAAHAMGLGAVWCGAYPNNDKNRVAKMKELLGLPESVYALNVIVLGYPAGEPTPKDKWDPAKVHYNKY